VAALDGGRTVNAQTNPNPSDNTLPASDSDYRRLCELLYREADLLAGQDYETWLTWLAPQLHYRIPLQVFQQRGAQRSYGGDPAWLDETLDSITIRAKQLLNPLSNAERVPSFMRYFVTNIFVDQNNDGFAVASQVLLIRVRANNPAPFFLSGRRQDQWVESDGRLLLSDREVTLDMPRIDSPNFAFFL
jgi:3-phenylpropionate/cinnamic acid dioxygenase small subunit